MTGTLLILGTIAFAVLVLSVSLCKPGADEAEDDREHDKWVGI